jgi:hypothetical protein
MGASSSAKPETNELHITLKGNHNSIPLFEGRGATFQFTLPVMWTAAALPDQVR